jgi:hypothetical protein
MTYEISDMNTWRKQILKYVSYYEVIYIYLLERKVLSIENWHIARGYSFTCHQIDMSQRPLGPSILSWAIQITWPGMAMAAMRCNDMCFNGPRIGCQLDSSLGTVQGFDSD